ncbi:MAG TPA: hypothetical protein PKC28_01745 [Bdellovibrionales bacterium]|nr:hypothetical protein [Bdellovibrionales bacterium]
MSNQNKALFVLLGVLMFSLSSLPGFSNPVQGSSELASLSDALKKCKLGDKLKDGESVTCDEAEIDGSKVQVKVTKKASEASAGETAAAMAAGAEKEEELEVEVRLETECSAGCEDGKRSNSNKVSVTSSLQDVTAKVLETARDEVKSLKADASKENSKAEKELACLIDEDGKTIDDTKAWNLTKIMKCRAETYADLKSDDPEKAAEYYDKYMREKLQELVSSKDASMRQLGVSAMTAIRGGKACNFQNNQLAAREITPLTYVQDSTCDLDHYARYQNALAYAQNDLDKARQMGDEEAEEAILKHAANLQKRWDPYFKSRLSFLNTADTLSNPWGNTLSTDIGEFQSALEANLKAIQNKHADMVKANRENGEAERPFTQGRDARGSVTRPSTGLDGSGRASGGLPGKACNKQYNGAPKAGPVSC